MKIQFHYNEQFAYFIFVAFIIGILCLISAASWFSSFLTGVFVYIFLRFTYFLWMVILKLFQHGYNGKSNA